MGYRQLPKKYISHVRGVVGNDLVEVAAITNAVNKRELGELRTLAAELEREGHQSDTENQYHQIIRSMITSGHLPLAGLDGIQGIETSDTDETISEEQFRLIVQTLAQAVENDQSGENDQPGKQMKNSG